MVGGDGDKHSSCPQGVPAFSRIPPALPPLEQSAHLINSHRLTSRAQQLTCPT